MTTARKAACVLAAWVLVAAALSDLGLRPRTPGQQAAAGVRLLRALPAVARHHLRLHPPLLRQQRLLPLGAAPDVHDPRAMAGLRRRDLAVVLPPHPIRAGQDIATDGEKHGTCSAPVVQDELQYFTIALDLYFKYNVTEMLSSGGIQVSNGKEYALSDVIDTIKHAFGGSPQIVCKNGSVQELRLCFDKELKPRDCLTTSLTNGSVSKSKHCPRYITLPTYDPLVLANSTVEIMSQFDEFVVPTALYTA